MRIERILIGVAGLALVLFLLGAAGSSKYRVEGFDVGGNMGAVRVDTGSGEVCFFGVMPDRYAAPEDTQPPTGGLIACYNK